MAAWLLSFCHKGYTIILVPLNPKLQVCGLVQYSLIQAESFEIDFFVLFLPVEIGDPFPMWQVTKWMPTPINKTTQAITSPQFNQ